MPFRITMHEHEIGIGSNNITTRVNFFFLGVKKGECLLLIPVDTTDLDAYDCCVDG
jgi:hypothetical protein